jgi:hypothetical protein
MAGNLTRYSYWQLRDFIRERGYALIIVTTLLGVSMIAPVRAMTGPEIGTASANQILRTVLPQIVYISAFIALNGLVSTDRKLGFYRFLFSKPVSIPAYYAQYFVVSLFGFLAVFAVLLGVYGFVIHPVNPVTPLIACAFVYLSFGGIAFLISSLFRHDWPILAGVYAGSLILNALWAQREGWRMVIRNALPPLNRLSGDSGVISNIMTGAPADTRSMVWLLGYSAICFVAGLIVLWRRPIG